jgi:uncharacterized membrane protein YeaQ/YmgE (transglycosylase-associated protein family)
MPFEETQDARRISGSVVMREQAEIGQMAFYGGSVMQLVWFLLIGLAAGWLAGKLVKGRGFGFGGNLIVGVVGSLLGGLMFDLLHLSAYGLIGSLVMAVAGSVALLYLIHFFKRI